MWFSNFFSQDSLMLPTSLRLPNPMSILAFAQWIQLMHFFTYMRSSTFSYPIVLSLHMCGIAIFGGMILHKVPKGRQCTRAKRAAEVPLRTAP